MVKWRTKMSKRDLFAMAMAECVGCGLFIFTGLGSVLGAQRAEKYDQGIKSNSTGIALAFGFTISWIVHAVSHVKGGHLNPAVSISLWVTEHITFVEMLVNTAAQLLGAILGAAVLDLAAGSVAGACNIVPHHMTTGQAFVLELVLTFGLCYTVIGSVDTRNEYNAVGPLKIGFSVVTAHLVAVPMTGCGINPARSFAAAVISDACWKDHWVFWLAPACAGVLAPLVYYNMSPFWKQWDTVVAQATARATKKAAKEAAKRAAQPMDVPAAGNGETYALVESDHA